MLPDNEINVQRNDGTDQNDFFVAKNGNLIALNGQRRNDSELNELIDSMQPHALNINQPTSNIDALSQLLATKPKRRRYRPELYKTVICQAWLQSEYCKYGEHCDFAHGEEELRLSELVPIPSVLKTKLCNNYSLTGLCAFGKRCMFIHPEDEPNDYICSDNLTKYPPMGSRNLMDNPFTSGNHFADPDTLLYSDDVIDAPLTPFDHNAPIVPNGVASVSDHGLQYDYGMLSRSMVDGPATSSFPTWPVDANNHSSSENVNMMSGPVSPSYASMTPDSAIGWLSVPGDMSGFDSDCSDFFPNFDLSPADAVPMGGNIAVNSQTLGFLSMLRVTEPTKSANNDGPWTEFDQLAEDLVKHLDL